MEGIFFYCTWGLVIVSNFFSSVGGSFFNRRRKIMSNFFFSFEWVVEVGSFFN